MTTESKLSGIDLARQTLIAAQEAAKKNGAPSKNPKRRTTTAVPRDGREPLGLGSAISRMMTERGMVTPAAGGTVLADFEAILAAAVPELAGRARGAAFDAETGRLDVVPDAPAVGTKLRWSAPKLIAAANERVPNANVRALRVLAPAPMETRPAPAAAAAAPQPVAPAGPVERRTPPEGYRRAIEAHRAVVTPSRVDPDVAEAMQRQIQAMRALSRRAFPEPPAVLDDAPDPIEQARVQRRRQAAATEAAAMRRARQERAARTQAEPGASEGAVRVVDRGEHQALAGGHVGGCHGAQGAAGEVGVVKGEPAAVAEPHALGPGEGLFLGKEVGDRVDGHEAKVDRDLVGVMTHRRVGGELAGQRGVRAGDNSRPRRAAT